MPGADTLRSLAAPPIVPVTITARITSTWRSVIMCGHSGDELAGYYRRQSAAGQRRTSPGIRITRNTLLDRRARQYGLACFHPVDMVERIPGRTNIRRSRMRLVMTHEIADQR